MRASSVDAAKQLKK